MKRYCLMLALIVMGLLFDSGQGLADDPPSVLDRLHTALADAIGSTGNLVESAEAVAGATDPAAVVWHATLEKAIDDARESGKPIFAVVGAPWCSFCEKLQTELKGDAEQEIAKQWVLAKINADDEVNDARELHANALPALRLLSSDGIVTVSRDGYAPVSQLSRWLEESYQQTKAQMPSLLSKDIAELDESEIETLIGLMAIRDVTARRVVLNRLSEMPQHAAGPAIDLLSTGKLANQLSALQLLKKWDAPVDGLDPWEPGSIKDDDLSRLKVWESEEFPNDEL